MLKLSSVLIASGFLLIGKTHSIQTSNTPPLPGLQFITSSVKNVWVIEALISQFLLCMYGKKIEFCKWNILKRYHFYSKSLNHRDKFLSGKQNNVLSQRFRLVKYFARIALIAHKMPIFTPNEEKCVQTGHSEQNILSNENAFS